MTFFLEITTHSFLFIIHCICFFIWPYIFLIINSSIPVHSTFLFRGIAKEYVLSRCFYKYGDTFLSNLLPHNLIHWELFLFKNCSMIHNVVHIFLWILLFFLWTIIIFLWRQFFHNDFESLFTFTIFVHSFFSKILSFCSQFFESKF